MSERGIENLFFGKEYVLNSSLRMIRIFPYSALKSEN